MRFTEATTSGFGKDLGESVGSPMDRHELKLGKGATSFVKSQLKQLRQENALLCGGRLKRNPRGLELFDKFIFVHCFDEGLVRFDDFLHHHPGQLLV